MQNTTFDNGDSLFFKRTEYFPKGRDYNIPNSEIESFRNAITFWLFSIKFDGWHLEFRDKERLDKLKSNWFDVVAKKSVDGIMFIAHILNTETAINIYLWCNDGKQAIMQIPAIYSETELKECAQKCHFCNKKVGNGKRVGFANYSCLECYSVAKKEIEYPGWCD